MAKELTNFVKLVVALIKGDDAQVLALKIQKKAVAALTSQIAVKQAYTLSLEDVLDQAVENLQMARINKGEAISCLDTYLKNLLLAGRALEAAEDTLDKHTKVIKFLDEELTAIQK